MEGGGHHVRIDPDSPWLREIGDAFLRNVYEEALRRDPGDAEALDFLAHDYTRGGRIAEGLALDRRLATLRPRDAVVRYNLACSLALSGDAETSIAELRSAVRLGYREAEHTRADEDLASLRGDPRFLRLLAEMEAAGEEEE
jgi:Flp pilus assembly protein TadD